MAKRVLLSLLKQYEHLQARIMEIDDEIERLVKPIPGNEEMIAMKGQRANRGDLLRCITNYEHPRQIQNLAGLVDPQSRSTLNDMGRQSKRRADQILSIRA